MFGYLCFIVLSTLLIIDFLCTFLKSIFITSLLNTAPSRLSKTNFKNSVKGVFNMFFSVILISWSIKHILEPTILEHSTAFFISEPGFIPTFSPNFFSIQEPMKFNKKIFIPSSLISLNLNLLSLYNKEKNLFLSNSNATKPGFSFNINDSTSSILCIAIWEVPIIVRFLYLITTKKKDIYT